MKKLCSIALCLAGLAACKTDSSSSSGAAPSTDPAATAPGRSAKIEQKAVKPVLPDTAAPDNGGDDRAARHKNREERMKEREAKLDTNGDGVVSDEERAAGMKQRVETMRTRLDANGDGKLTADELAGAKGRMRFDDPAALDTNKDGDISADELQAAMKARMDKWRNGGGPGGRAGSGATTPGAPDDTE